MHPLNWTVETKQSATSTSDLAKQAALEGAPHGSGYLAIEQTAGRGRRGRHWSSLEGGMYLSVLLRPEVEKKFWFVLSFAASLAVLDTVREQLEKHFDVNDMPQIGVKWPNDVMMAGGKIAGILLESEGQALIVGSGINIAPVREKSFRASHYQAPPNALIVPMALADVWPQTAEDLPSPHQLASSYMTHLAYWYSEFESDGFAGIRNAWLSNALFLGKTLSVQRGRSKISGIFLDLSWDGALILLDDSGETHHISTGDVKLLDR